MADVKGPPPPRASDKSGAGVAAGVFLGVVGSVLGSALVILSHIGASESGGTCQRNIVLGFAEAVVVLGLGALAWYLFFRVKRASFWLGFARGIVVSVTVMMLIPWPCSLGFWAVENLTCFST
jgi:hypothetical protein